MANKYINDLRPWPAGLPLPTDGLAFFYDPSTDEEYSFIPEQLVGSLTPPALSPNSAPSAVVHIVRYASLLDPRWTPGISTLESLIAGGELGLEHRAIVVDPLRGAPKSYVFRYEPGTINCWRDGDRRDKSSGAWFDATSAEAGVPTWTELQANPPTPSYNFAVGDFIRHAVAPSTVQFFFSARMAGPLPAPTDELGDNNWQREARENIPTTVRPAFENIVGDPADNPALAAALDAASNRAVSLALAAAGRAAVVRATGQVYQTYEQAEAQAPGIKPEIVLVGWHNAISVDRDVRLSGSASVGPITLNYMNPQPVDVEITGLTLTGRTVVCAVTAGETTVHLHDCIAGPGFYLESFGLGVQAGTATVLVERLRAINAVPYSATGNGVQGTGMIRFQERNGSTVFTVRDSTLQSRFGTIASGYTASAGTSRLRLEGATALFPAPGKPVQETTIINSYVTTPDDDFLIDDRAATAPGGITSASLSLNGQTLTLNTSAGNSSVTLPGSSGTSTNYTQIRSVNGKRVVEIPVLSPVTVLEEIFDQNVQGVEYQLDLQTRTGPRQYGTAGISRADVLPLLAALTPADFAAGVKLYARTVVTSPPDPANLILKFEYA